MTSNIIQLIVLATLANAVLSSPVPHGGYGGPSNWGGDDSSDGESNHHGPWGPSGSGHQRKGYGRHSWGTPSGTGSSSTPTDSSSHDGSYGSGSSSQPSDTPSQGPSDSSPSQSQPAEPSNPAPTVSSPTESSPSPSSDVNNQYGAGSTTPIGSTTPLPSPSKNSPPSSPSSAPSSPGYGSGSSADAQPALDAHNAARAQNGIPAMTWDDSLAQQAQTAAAAQGCLSLHHTSAGQNLWGSSGGAKPAWTSIVASWMDEPKGSSDYNHATQVLWRTSIKLGCAIVTVGNGCWSAACQYGPVGNMVGSSWQTGTKGDAGYQASGSSSSGYGSSA